MRASVSNIFFIINRYKLLLGDLLRHTKDTHLHYSKLNGLPLNIVHVQITIAQCCFVYNLSYFLVGATQQLEAITSHINEQVRQQENSRRMLSIQNSLTGKFVPGILVPGRRFIREGRLMKVFNPHS